MVNVSYFFCLVFCFSLPQGNWETWTEEAEVGCGVQHHKESDTAQQGKWNLNFGCTLEYEVI